MVKKGANKKPADVSPASTAAPSPSSAACSESWLDALSADDRRFAISTNAGSLQEFEAKKEKREADAKKASEQQKQQVRQNERYKQWEKDNMKQARAKAVDERKWQKQAEMALQRGLKEGILVAEDWGDGVWWCKGFDPENPETYKQVEDMYYCTLCDKHLNDNTLESHLDSNGHKKKLSWTQWDGDASPSAPAASPAAAPAAASPKASPKAAAEEYPAPALPWLAWVDAPPEQASKPGERWQKCLLCDKWIQDEWSHSGSPEVPDGSKDHQKKLRNYHEWYEDYVREERRKYHPEPTVCRTTSAAAASRPPPAAPPPPPGPPPGPPPAAPSGRAPPTPAPWAFHRQDSGEEVEV